ncbi:MAG: LysR family transcriptional regulator, partial [Gracilibacteraceae bacterium]|nr:LysR family transcriptional regulator [Gracilibacteraceae bacterium]
GNISMAARELFLAQSTVSRTVQNLEQELGCKLLVRSTQGVRLTDEGEILYRHLKAAFMHIRVAEERLDNIQRLNEGILRIGASELTLEFYLLPFLEKLKREHPKISLQLSYSNPERAVTDLNSGLLDIAVLASPLIESGSIWTFPIMDIDYTLVGGPGFSELKDGVHELRDLMEYPFICMEKGMSVRMYADKMAQGIGAVLRPECEVGSMPLLISMVQVNLGLGFAPAPHVQSALEAGTLFPIRLKEKLPRESICLLTSGTIPYNMLTAHFLKMLID